MNTQMPITNVSSAKTPALTTSQAESLTAEVPFNQLLSKEVKNRNSSSNSSNLNNTETQPQAKVQQAPAKQAEAPREAAQEPAKNNSAAAAATATGAAASSNATAKTEDADSAKEDVHAKKDDDEGNDTPASAQMLALVANVGQMNNQAQPVARKGAQDNMDALANQKDGKKAIGQISAKDKQEHLRLQAEEKDTQGHGKGEMFALGGGAALEGKQELLKDGKQGADDKPGNPLQHAAGEKGLPESPLLAKNNLAGGPDGPALAHNTPKFAVDPKMQPAGAENNQLPTAATVVPAMQQAMTLNQQAAATGQAVDRLTPPVGSQGWDQAVGQKVVWMAAGGMQSASLTLNPPDLGPLQVVLHVNNDQADATFITAQPEVKQALEAAMPKLREMLDTAGIQLGQATVNTGMPNQQQGANQQQQANNGSASSHFGAAGNDAELHVATVPMRPQNTGGLGLVDTFA